MRAPGIPKLLSGRWAPCAALVLGAVSFVGFALLAIPEHIGSAVAETGSKRSFANHFARTQAADAEPSSAWSGGSLANSTPGATPITRFASQAGAFPRRGFSPPLDRPERTPPPAPPPEPAASPSPAPVAAPAAQPPAVEVAAPPPGAAPPVQQTEPPAPSLAPATEPAPPQRD